METFLSVILSIILGIYLLGKISKWLLRYWLKKKMQSFEQGNAAGGNPNSAWGAWSNFGQQQQQPQQEKKKEGNVTVDINPTSERKIDKAIGEYVEFDEIKEESISDGK